MSRRFFALLAAGALALSSLVFSTPPVQAANTGSISGTISWEGGPPTTLSMMVCSEIFYGLESSDCTTKGTSVDVTTGTYSVSGLLPDVAYTLVFTGRGYLPTWLGGYAESTANSYLDTSKMTWVAIPSSGGDVPDQNVTLVEGLTISGNVTPASAENIQVKVCNTDFCSAADVNGGSYSVTVGPGNGWYVMASADGYLTTMLGGVVLDGVSGDYYDYSDSATVIGGTGGDVISGQDLTLVQAAFVSGKVTPADAPNMYLYACEITDQQVGSCHTQYTTNGSYTLSITPGKTIAISATATGYLATWLGGYSSASSWPDIDLVTKVQAPAAGQTRTAGDIELQKVTSISGKVILPDGYSIDPDNTISVALLEVAATANGLSKVGSIWAGTSSDGTYTAEVAPGKQYVIYAEGAYAHSIPETGFITTAYGGYISHNAYGLNDDELTKPGVTVVSVPTDGTPVTGKDIEMRTGDVVSGMITPAAAVNKQVWACEIATFEWGEDTSTCRDATVAEDGSYSVTVFPGATAVIGASADGYVTTWYGGYANMDGSVDLGNSQVARVTAPASGKNITLQKTTLLSGRVNLPEGYSIDGNRVNSVEITEVATTQDGLARVGSRSASIASDGTYTMEVAPGRQYVVYVRGDSIRSTVQAGFMTTAYGGYVGHSIYGLGDDELNKPGVTVVSVPTDGTPVADVDIDVETGAVVSGRITPTTAVNKQVEVCEVVVYSWGEGVDNCQTPDVATDGTYSASVYPGATVIVQAWADGYLNTWLGGYVSANQWPSLSSDQVARVDAPASGQDIELQKATIISGKITPAAATNKQGQVCEVVAYSWGEDTSNCRWVYVAEDGSYSTIAMPGTTVVVEAWADGYLYTWLGGYSASWQGQYDLSDSSISKVQLPDEGGTLTKQDIELTKAASVSGKVTLPAGYTFDGMNWSSVRAYGFDPTSGALDSAGYIPASIFPNDGTYTFTTLVPEKQYLIVAVAEDLRIKPSNDFVTTTHGGYASQKDVSSWDLSNPEIGLVTAKAAGTTGVNIDMVKGAIISGKITPASAVNPQVTVCEVEGVAPNQWTGPCSYPQVQADGSYSATVTPDSTVVVYGTADGYLYSWIGGYVDSNTLYSVNDESILKIQAPRLGETLTNQNVSLVKAASVSGKVILPSGYSFDDSSWNYVTAYQVDSSSGSPRVSGYGGSAWISSNGTYTFTTLTPGREYLIVAESNDLSINPSHDFLTTTFGGYATPSTDVYGWDLTSSGIDLVLANAKGTTGVDIELVKGVSISGRVILPDGYTFDESSSSYVAVYEADSSSNQPRYVTSALIAADGTYTVNKVSSDKQYFIVAESGSLTINPSNDFLTTAYGGYSSSGYAGNWDVTTPGIDPVTAGADGITGIDITLVRAAIISGTVTPANANYKQVQVCEVLGDASYQYPGECWPARMGDGGSYSASVKPGSTVVIQAVADGYLYTWLGGYSASAPWQYSVNDDSIVKIQAPALGETVAGQDIDLAKSASISGTVSLPDGYTWDPASLTPVGAISFPVTAYEVNVSQDTYQVSSDSVPGWAYGLPTGPVSYSIDKLTPGKQYLVVVNQGNLGVSPSNDLLTTTYGGYASQNSLNNWDLNSPMVGLVTANADGTPGIDITMAKGAIISGKVTPANAQNKQVQVCIVATSYGSQYADTCWSTAVRSDGTYSVAVDPGAGVVISAKADDYLYTYLGGYSASSTSYQVNDQMTIVYAPTGGQPLSGQDIDLVKAAAISGTVTLPDGYTLSYGYLTVAEVVETEYGPNTNNLVWGTIASDGTYRVPNLIPGVRYVVWVSPDNLYLDKGQASGLLTTAYDGYFTTNSYLYRNDLTDPGMTFITASGERTGVDLAMVVGATITGTVYLPDGTPATDGSVSCYEVGRSSDSNSSYAVINGDGSYTCKALPGRKYSVLARVSGYPAVWRGGAVGESPASPDKVTVITAPASGKTQANQDITLVVGASISGKLTYEADPDYSYAGVEACLLHDDGNTSDCVYAYESGIDENGNYTLDGLVPGASYIIYGWARGYENTYYGGFVGDQPPLPHAKVKEIATPAMGGNVSNINITLVRPVIITGSIQPSSVTKGSDGVYVYACPAYVQDGQGYYVTQMALRGGSASLSATLLPTTDPQDVAGAWCRVAWVSPDSDGTYSMNLTPGVDYIVIGQASGYVDTWYGGYEGDSSIDGNALPDDMVDRVLPSAGVTLVSGQAGDTVTDVNIVFKELVTVTFVTDGGTPAMVTASTTVGGTVTLPANPSKAGYVFDGWYTQPNGEGLPFTATKAVSESLTVYAKWVPSPVFTVTYNANGGTGTVSDQTSYYAGDQATVAQNAFTRTGWDFQSWNTAADGSGTSYASGASLTMSGNLTLYAQWKEHRLAYAVTFVDGLGNTLAVVNVLEGGVATPPADPTREGYVFAGWDTNLANITSDLTVTATWTKVVSPGDNQPNGGDQPSQPSDDTQESTVPTGGTAQSNGFLLLIASGLVLAGLFVRRLKIAPE